MPISEKERFLARCGRGEAIDLTRLAPVVMGRMAAGHYPKNGDSGKGLCSGCLGIVLDSSLTTSGISRNLFGVAVCFQESAFG